MRTLRNTTAVLALMAFALAAHDVQAVPIAAGSLLSISGQDSYTNTALTFNGNGNIGADTASGSFSPAFTTGCIGCVTLHSFQYNPLPATIQIYSTGLSGNTTTFTITSVDSFINGAFLNIAGHGTATLSGFDPSPATILISSQAGGNNVTFSAQVRVTQSTTPIPEPATAALLGAGLVLFGIARRSRTTRLSA